MLWALIRCGIFYMLWASCALQVPVELLRIAVEFCILCALIPCGILHPVGQYAVGFNTLWNSCAPQVPVVGFYILWNFILWISYAVDFLHTAGPVELHGRVGFYMLWVNTLWVLTRCGIISCTPQVPVELHGRARRGQLGQRGGPGVCLPRSGLRGRIRESLCLTEPFLSLYY